MLAGKERKYYMLSGKGGVGKTSCATSLEVRFANYRHPTMVVLTDTAHSLRDSLAQNLRGGRLVPVEGVVSPLYALEINPEKSMEEFRAASQKHGDGMGVKSLMQSTGLGMIADQINWICPTAPTRPVAILGGFPCTAYGRLVALPAKPCWRVYSLQITGIDATVYYSPEIFKVVGIKDNSKLLAATVAVGISKTIFILVAIVLVDKLGRKPLLYISTTGMTICLYYSLYEYAKRLAEEIKKGADFVDGVEATLWYRRHFRKRCLAKWEHHRRAMLTAITQLVHHGMLFVPIRCTFSGGMFEMNEVKGGSPYSAGTYAGGDGSRQQLNLSWSKHSTKASILPPSLRSSRKNEAIHKLGY
ncbi:hypothetical protein Ahy_A07g036564 [Arachis hypogaea]|uniref:ArsA/GET3 Anion-transporting ATPase-like domain-containing protein n=1 Tax=Arachis hypogaea TaxID=3818 RepID=A0A445CGG1_ARAHY|nr:hypothetical protein Ahy_A07g036564 [Arachis hypogaea]